MLSFKRVAGVQSFARRLSTVVKVEEAKAVAPSTAAAVTKSGGSSFFQRLSSFLAGCGVGFGVSAYFIYNELEESNKKFAQDIEKIQAAIKK